MKKNYNMELLAPAGNTECLKAAVQSGADAVYFAGKQFGARSFADNFSDHEIKEAAEYCRLYGVKSYVTVNTMTLDRELSELDRWVTVLAESAVDGVIVQDLGVAERIRRICPSLPLHASTQMTVHNADGVRALEELGFTRVVLARELSKADMAAITAQSRAEIEVFIHGAMCMSYSGQCLMSSMLGGRSGNRGKCAQPCRLPYHAEGSREGFYFSLKDMSLLSHIQELSEMGVASLKIEGRMKGVDYVSAVVRTYRDCIDAMRRPTPKETERMERIFNRGGLTDGYFTQHKGKTMFAFHKPSNPYAQNTEDERPQRERKIAVRAEAYFAEGEAPRLIFKTDRGSITHTQGEALEAAQKNAASAEKIEAQLTKTGGTPFYLTDISVKIEKNPFVSMKEINALRRGGLEKLEGLLSEAEKRPILSVTDTKRVKRKPHDTLTYTASVQNAAQFEAVKHYPFYRIGVPLHIAAKDMLRFEAEKERIILSMPAIVSEGERETVQAQLCALYDRGFRTLCAENIGQLAPPRPFDLWCGHRMNLANSEALEVIGRMGVRTACVSAELNLAQIRDLSAPCEIEMLAYGHLPLMLTENCVLQNVDACPCGGHGVIYDRKDTPFPVIKDGDSCRSVILNSVPLYMGDKKEALRTACADRYRLSFTVEDADLCRAVCEAYFQDGHFDRPYTRQHYLKGLV